MAAYAHQDNFRVYVYPKKSNHKNEKVFQIARSLSDSEGYLLAKLGQRNPIVLKNGYLKLRFATRSAAKRVQALIDEFLGHLVTTRRTKVRHDDE